MKKQTTRIYNSSARFETVMIDSNHLSNNSKRMINFSS